MSGSDDSMNIEVIVIPVSDVDRAKRFYSKLGWRLAVNMRRFRSGLGRELRLGSG